MQDNNIPPAEAAEFSRAFDLYVRLDEAKAQADAARLRLMDADRSTSALECEARERLVEATEAKVANIEAELEALKASHQGQDAEPRADEAQPVAAVAKRGPRRETQAGRVARCLTDCETRAAAHGEPFDRKNMPGTKSEFLGLLHALHAELRSIETVVSLDRYLSKTGCKWPLNAGKQPSAAPLYARLFPEARIRAPGAVSPQRRKA